ncbi:hypothetical protein FHG87_017342 [Trinorchestia longiramus]|nr:hypothetical protein FHG87_017342 [Trinorchestia longiramus]
MVLFPAESTTTAGRVNESTSVLPYDYLAVTLNESETLDSQKDTAGDFRLSVNSDVNGAAKDNPHTQAACGTDFVESSCVDTMQEIVPVMARKRKSSRNDNYSKRIQCQDTPAYSAKLFSEILPKASTQRLFPENGTSDAANLTRISSGRINYSLNAKTHEGFCSPDKRGRRKAPNKTPECTRTRMSQFIYPKQTLAKLVIL